MRGFLAGFVAGALVVWFFRDDIQEYLDEQTRLVRVGAADRLHSVGETADRAFDMASSPVHRAEEILDQGKAKVSDTLRSAERNIRP